MEITIFFLFLFIATVTEETLTQKKTKEGCFRNLAFPLNTWLEDVWEKKDSEVIQLSRSSCSIFFFFGTRFSPLLLLQSYQEKSSALPCPQIVLCASLCSQGNNFDALPPTRSVSLAHLVLSHRHQKSTLSTLFSTQYVLSTSQ